MRVRMPLGRPGRSGRPAPWLWNLGTDRVDGRIRRKKKLWQYEAPRNSGDPSVNNSGPVSDVEMFSSCHLGFYLESPVEICENSYVGFNHHTATQSQPPTIKE